jgi:2'-5' RNA ligase
VEVDLRGLQRQAAARADRYRDLSLETAVAIVLDDARAQLEPVRSEFHAGSVAMGIPLHLTLLYPFAPPDQADEEALADFFAAREPMTVTLVGVAEWPAVVYAVPEPRDDLSELMRALWERFPDYPPYGGEIADPLPHVTLAESGEDESTAELAAAIRARTNSFFPLSCDVRDVALLEEHEPDRWRERRRFPLGRSAAA